MKTNSTQKIVIIVLAVLLVLALIFGGFQLSRSSALRTQLDNVQETLDSKNADLAAAADELESTKAALADLTETQQTENEAKAEALRAKEAELETAKAELEATIAALEDAEDAQNAKDAELTAAKAELETVKAELESVKAELAELARSSRRPQTPCAPERPSCRDECNQGQDARRQQEP